MLKRALRVLLGVVMAVGAGACSSSAKTGGSTTSPGQAPTTAPAGTGLASVSASDALKFSPGTLTVSVGQTVTWSNGGTISHTVTFDSGPAFDQPLSAGGATVTRLFAAAGTFTYHCSIHGPSMHGTIVVK